MKKIARFAIAALAFMVAAPFLSAQNLVPEPASVQLAEGSYSIGDVCRIKAPKSCRATRDIMAGYLSDVCGVSVKRGRNVVFRLDSKAAPESYELSVSSRGIRITGDEAGLFYGMRTLQQLMDQYGKDIPCITVKDAPRFEWRGLMLDCGRYFYSVEYIKKYIDLLSRFKMNRFHWHLTEDAGWRIEIKSHPELTATAAWRNTTLKNWDGYQDNIPNGGYYSQNQVREIVKYAQDRHVTIIPEVDLPGHTQCVIAAHPELGCTGERIQVATTWRVKDEVLCIGNPGTLELIKDILGELIDMFPSEYIDIGGDEAPVNHWSHCPKCQEMMAREGMKEERELQSWLTARMGEFCEARGRKILGWDEILEGAELSKSAAVMSWRGVKGGIKASALGHKVVMAPNSYMYIDYYQDENHANEPYNIGGFLPLEKVYSYEPFDPQMSEKDCQNIMGVQANLWCEFVHGDNIASYMTYPRALAVAEVGWSDPAKKDWKCFRDRMTTPLAALDRDQVPFRIPEPYGLKEAVQGESVTLEAPVEGSEIYFTLNGEDPQSKGSLYTGGKIDLVAGDTLKCSVKLPSGRYSMPYYLAR